jgi:hypothetical protein
MHCLTSTSIFLLCGVSEVEFGFDGGGHSIFSGFRGDNLTDGSGHENRNEPMHDSVRQKA